MSKTEGFNFERDYLIGLPSADMNTMINRMAKHSDISAFDHAMYTDLMLPEWQGSSWARTQTPLFIRPDVMFFRPHGFRAFAVSRGAEMMYSKERKDQMGGWHLGQSADYVRAAKAIMRRSQDEIE